MKDRWQKRRTLQTQLLELTGGCAIQHTGWPCNRCFHALDLPGVDDDRLHEFWQATLILRGDYKNGEYGVNFSDAELSTAIDGLLAATKVVRH